MINNMGDVVLLDVTVVQVVDVADTARRCFGDKAAAIAGSPLPPNDYRFHIAFGDGGSGTFDTAATAADIVLTMRQSGRMIKARDLKTGDHIIACPAAQWRPAGGATVTRPELSTDQVLMGLFWRGPDLDPAIDDRVTQLDADADVIIRSR